MNGRERADRVRRELDMRVPGKGTSRIAAELIPPGSVILTRKEVEKLRSAIAHTMDCEHDMAFRRPVQCRCLFEGALVLLGVADET